MILSQTSIIVMLSILVLLQWFLIAYPLIKRKLSSQPKLMETTDPASLEDAVARAAKRMLSSRRVSMSFSDDESLYALLARLKNRLIGRREHHAYAYFNFPLAFLLLGFLDRHASNGDQELLDDVERKCGDLLDDRGDLKFVADKVDQAVFGLVFLRLYELTQKDRYLAGARQLRNGLLHFRRDDGLYRYRNGIDVFFIDTVGLLCPFLVKYAAVTGDSSSRVDAETQVKFALSNCVDPRLGLAFHAFDLVRGQPLGSVNWARGTGWLLLGLSAVAETGRDPAMLSALGRYRDVLERLREPSGYWPQFLGHTNDRQMDSSASLMFLYALQACGVCETDVDELQRLASQCVDRDGNVVSASGDTIYINKYSRVKGRSELSQGLMLSLIAGPRP